ncbi:MFS transporter [Thermocrinis sp.]
MDRFSAYRFIFLMGLVSLFSDFTYEGGRSILGPYLAVLSATPLVIGFLSGLSEFLGYALRLLFGYLSDLWKRPWMFVIFGYILNLFSIPAMALAPTWQYVGAMMVLERLGKALRTPSREALLSHATEKVGHGKGFGMHEFLDQLGALAGPFFVAGVLYFTHSYRFAFASLVFSALLALVFLIISKKHYKEENYIKGLDNKGGIQRGKFTYYVIFSFFLGLSFVPFGLTAYFAKFQLNLHDATIPFIFGMAMLIDGVFALIFGYLFDRLGFKVLAFGVLSTSLYPYFIFSQDKTFFLFGVLLWGAQLGLQESVLRSAVAKLSSPLSRGTAFGIFHFFYGLSMLMGGTAMGYFYQTDVRFVIIFSVLAQFLSIAFLLKAYPQGDHR